jgi:hypothetical protein|tara:strand:+ start:112 stop:249 length:138 start_codon:yes stop_codon:yes gene_type:complete
METYEDKEGNVWSKEIKDGRLVEKLIKPKKAAPKKKAAKKSSKKQ